MDNRLASALAFLFPKRRAERETERVAEAADSLHGELQKSPAPFRAVIEHFAERL